MWESILKQGTDWFNRVLIAFIRYCLGGGLHWLVEWERVLGVVDKESVDILWLDTRVAESKGDIATEFKNAISHCIINFNNIEYPYITMIEHPAAIPAILHRVKQSIINIIELY